MTAAGARCVAKLPNVTWLDASGGTLCDIGVSALSEMTQLTYLSVSQNDRISDESIVSLLKLTCLRSLNLSGTRVTASRLHMLASLTALTSLALYNTQAKPCQVKRLYELRPDIMITGLPGVVSTKAGGPRSTRT